MVRSLIFWSKQAVTQLLTIAISYISLRENSKTRKKDAVFAVSWSKRLGSTRDVEVKLLGIDGSHIKNITECGWNASDHSLPFRLPAAAWCTWVYLQTQTQTCTKLWSGYFGICDLQLQKRGLGKVRRAAPLACL